MAEEARPWGPHADATCASRGGQRAELRGLRGKKTQELGGLTTPSPSCLPHTTATALHRASQGEVTGAPSPPPSEGASPGTRVSAVLRDAAAAVGAVSRPLPTSVQDEPRVRVLAPAGPLCGTGRAFLTVARAFAAATGRREGEAQGRRAGHPLTVGGAARRRSLTEQDEFYAEIAGEHSQRTQPSWSS